MTIISANGAEMPAIGLGTWTLRDNTATRLVAAAIESGYRHIDTAAMYDNEDAVGAGIKAAGLPRAEIFLTTKVWHTDLSAAAFKKSVAASLARLQQDYVDLLLIHWPSKDVPLAETIGALNAAKDQGFARHIGVSNFNVAMINEAVGCSHHPLVCNQIEYHPFLNQDKVLAACRAHGMAVTAYCPLARESELLTLPDVTSIAAAHGKSPAQVILRWLTQQQNVAAIPRSSKPERIRENGEIFDFTLSDAEVETITALQSRNFRICDFDFAPKWD